MDKITVVKAVLSVLLTWLLRDDDKDGVPDVLEPFLTGSGDGPE